MDAFNWLHLGAGISLLEFWFFFFCADVFVSGVRGTGFFYLLCFYVVPVADLCLATKVTSKCCFAYSYAPPPPLYQHQDVGKNFLSAENSKLAFDPRNAYH